MGRPDLAARCPECHEEASECVCIDDARPGVCARHGDSGSSRCHDLDCPVPVPLGDGPGEPVLRYSLD